MSISSSLGDLNYKRNQSWSLPFNTVNSRQAIYDQGLEAENFNAKQIKFAQKHLRILSGLYGILNTFRFSFAAR